MRTGPNIRKRIDGRYEARYEKGRNEAGRIIYGYCYGKTYEEAETKRAAILGLEVPEKESFESTPKSESIEPKRMSLLILGAGSLGLVIKEIAESLRIFQEIAFLDDDPASKMAIAPLSSYEKLCDRYPMAAVALEDGHLREEYIENLTHRGYILPNLIHPTVTLSSSAVIRGPVIVGENCIVSAGANIGRGAIISAGSVIGAATKIGCFAFLDAGTSTFKESVVEDYGVTVG